MSSTDSTTDTTPPTTPPAAGDVVRWWDKNGGWQFGTVATVDGAVVRVHAGTDGPISRKRPGDLHPWPPRTTPPTTDDTTPPSTRAKRKGVNR